MSDFSTEWDTAKDEMFKNVEDPLKSKWWNKAWEIMLDPKFGPVVSETMPSVEVALWLIELRNIHTGYELMYWDYDYDPLWLDYWDATGLPWEHLVSYLAEKGLLEDTGSDISRDDGAADDVRGAVHIYCWSKRQAIFDALLLHFEDTTSLGMFMLGGKIPRNRDRAHRIVGFADNQFDF